LAGKRVLVTAGGTREPLDPVRYLGNRSSGRQGVALAAAAAGMGAQVTVIGCNVAEGVTGGLPAGVRLLPVSTTAELGAALDAEAGTADLVLMAAAVADYRPETVSDGKIKKTAGADDLVLRLVQNPDLLRGLVAQRPEGQRIVGFAAETATDARELLELGRRKAAAKGADALVLNEVGWALGMDQPDNRVTLLSAEGAILGLADGTKDEVASAILRFLLSAWDDLSG
ncbi:phosphopantothenoylcysteine decarboxylase domain-containing protein, partial [Leucobacter sp. M11]|uniref:phosphopantothenoylcysteine decarboxylase domain-containing protein n=1 Tax=Leucobacter sp. M11 TaxID=2993565 RepID=UPI002D802839